MPTGALNICCPRDCVSRPNGGTRSSPIMPRDVSLSDSKCWNGGHELVNMDPLQTTVHHGIMFSIGLRAPYNWARVIIGPVGRNSLGWLNSKIAVRVVWQVVWEALSSEIDFCIVSSPVECDRTDNFLLIVNQTEFHMVHNRKKTFERSYLIGSPN